MIGLIAGFMLGALFGCALSLPAILAWKRAAGYWKKLAEGWREVAHNSRRV
jgi:hypothetical protein